MTTRKPFTKTTVSAPNTAINVIEFPRARVKATTMSAAGVVNQLELTSIKALTSYVAHNQNVPEDVVRAYLQAEFRVDDITQLRRDDYERAVAFLVDLRCALLLN